MSNGAVVAALEALRDSLQIQAAVEGARILVRLIPDLETLDLKDYAIEVLASPVTAPFFLTGAIKDVDFPTGKITEGGSLVADPLPDFGDLAAGDTPESPTEAVSGWLFGMEGQLPIGFVSPPRAAVSAEVAWVARRACDDAEDLGYAADDDPDFDGTTKLPETDILVIPPLVPRVAGWESKSCLHCITAHVTLRALGEELSATVGPIDVEVPAVGVPTTLVVFSEVAYNTVSDKGRFVIVPAEVPIENLNVLGELLGKVRDVLSPVDKVTRIAGFLTGLGRVLNALRPKPVGNKHRLHFTSADEIRKLKDLPWWRYRKYWKNKSPNNDIDSLLLLSLDKKVELYRRKGFGGDRVTATPDGKQHWIGIPDFHNVTVADPSGASVQADRLNFHDKASSVRFEDR